MNTELFDLSRFVGIDLKDMGKIKLMKRVDRKFVTSVHSLQDLFDSISDEYYIQEIEGRRCSDYVTLYYDTPDYQMYHMHQNGKLHRTKIRTREYTESQLFFLEVKEKSNKGVTEKKRIKFDNLRIDGHTECDSFIHSHSPYFLAQIEPKLWTYYTRITLVDKGLTERLTIDFNLHYRNQHNLRHPILPDLAIIELKKDLSSESPITKHLNKARIKPRGMSKYCLGVALTEDIVKHNVIKEKIIYLRKLTPINYVQ